MDLVNQDLEVREQLKEAYVRNKIVINGKELHNELQQGQRYLTEGQRYLIGEPSGNEKDLPNGSSMKTIEQKHESKWAVGFFAQISILFRRNWILTSKAQFHPLMYSSIMFTNYLCNRSVAL